MANPVFTPVTPSDGTFSVAGAAAWLAGFTGPVTDANLTLTDVTTNNATTSAHGFLLKLNNSATSYMDGTGAWSTPGSSLTSGTTAVSGGANYAVLREDGSAKLIADSSLLFGGAAAGTGLSIAAGTATTDVNALSLTQTWNNAAVTTGVKISITDIASASTANLLSVNGGAAGTTNYWNISKTGILWAPASTFGIGASGTKAVIGVTTISTTSELDLFNGNYNSVNSSWYANATTSSNFKLNSSGICGFTAGNDGSSGAAFTTTISQAGSGIAQIGTTTANASGSLNLVNLTTTATASTGTAAIIDGSNVLRPLTSSERFKTNMRDWVPSAKEISAFLSLPQMLFDYQDQPARIEPERMIPAVIEKQPSPILDSKGNAPLVDVIIEPEQIIPAWEIEPARQGVKDVLGLSAEKIDAAGLSWLVNYDAQGLPYSLREHGVLSFLIALVKQQQNRIAALEAA